MKREILNQVRELLERNLSVTEIAQRLNVDLDLVRIAAEIINQLLT